MNRQAQIEGVERRVKVGDHVTGNQLRRVPAGQLHGRGRSVQAPGVGPDAREQPPGVIGLGDIDR